MMKFKDTLKLIVTLSVIIVLIAGFYFYRESQEINGPGEIELVIASENEEVLYEDVLAFNAGDTLYDVLKVNFMLTCASNTYQADPTCSSSIRFFADGSTIDGKIILGVKGDTFEIMTDWDKTYLAIQVYDNSSYRLTTKGVSGYTLKDGEKIRIIVTKVSGW